MQLKPIDQQVVAVVGTYSRIGREIAIQFPAWGAKLVVSACSEPGLDSLVDEIRQIGGEAIAVPAAVADLEQVKVIADRAIQQYERFDTWVHLATINLYAIFEQTTPREEFNRVIDVNQMRQVHGAMAALLHLKRRGRGSLLHLSERGRQTFVPIPQCLQGIQVWN